ncbi:hypothetical protein FNV43_RR17872 [Rhamnella rubrinervis]|uniref:Histone-binding protein RBBP4-like N-terminal domain-containing protein n=1 Tax=Rhamnella rubrinervis TaxID=2594499 RepID=A0A8K0E544_9ROSA|nr:hypothetical protein FNV43_RR17872 [Rhamnella rubrinervis]
MPGTILVSVLEFIGLPSSSAFSSISIKVSMGKREYQTWEKGDFSFPLTSLHDNLIVLLQDAEGNEISHAGVETKSIVEKGLWDDLFPLEGGGQVHMKLQFVLNEDERNRIRLMRESALNKKHQEPFDSRIKSLQNVPIAGSNAASSLCLNHEISDRNEETSSAIPMSQRVDVHLTKLSHRELHEKAQSLSANIPTGSISSEVAAFSFGSSELAVPSTSPESLLDGITEDLEKQGLRKKASNSVRKMISVFESSLAQETSSHKIPLSTKLQSTKVGMYLQEHEVNNMRRAQSTGQLDELSTIKVRNKGTNISPKNKVNLLYKELDRKEEKSCGDLMGTSTLETSSVADMMGNQLRRQSCNLFSSRQDSGGKVVSSKHAKRWNIEGDLAHKLDPVASYEDMLSSFEESGAWILPDQARRFCLTTDGKKLMDLLGGHIIKPSIHEAKMNISVPDTVVEPTGDGGTGTEGNSKKKTYQAQKSKPKIEDVETSVGPFGQAIKVVIMGSTKGDGSSSSSSIPSRPAKVWQPGVDKLEEDEELECDPSAYNSLHAFHIGWPCLSFDVVRDSLGLVRTEFPHTVYFVAGTQAEKASWNSIGIFKISNISGKRRELVPKPTGDGSDMDNDDSDSDTDSEDEGVGGSGTPILLLRKVAHEGCINRIRAMTQNPHISASWADTGHVQIWDFSSHLNALAESESETSQGASSVLNQAPLIKFGHKDEGYAIDWSPLVTGRLLSGDCKNHIHLWEPTSSTWNVDATPFIGHVSSIEDLQWSPTERDVFASCSVDGKISIWDIRIGKSPAASFKAHNADVNVISWNRLASCMLASGSDDGTFSIRDLRLLKEGDSVVANFEYHKHPITSIEWSPHEASTLAVSSSDNQLTIWDLSLEKDEEEEAEFKAKTKEQVHAPADIPPQLLFVHQGQKDLKELHWHTQIPGMLVSTAADGFNILMPSNIQSTLPSDGA